MWIGPFTYVVPATGICRQNGVSDDNNIVWGRTQACLISVIGATPSPTREADEKISFG
jgi:hypothetical protein